MVLGFVGTFELYITIFNFLKPYCSVAFWWNRNVSINILVFFRNKIVKSKYRKVESSRLILKENLSPLKLIVSYIKQSYFVQCGTNLKVLVNRTRVCQYLFGSRLVCSLLKKEGPIQNFLIITAKLDLLPKESFPLFFLPLFSDLIVPIASERSMIGYFSTQFSSDFSRVWS